LTSIKVAPPEAAQGQASASPTKGKIMSKERIEGAAQKTVGAVKQAVGKAIGSDRLQVEGVADKVVGTAKETVGKAKDALHKATR
jgi:uncharacterized protein YjbJ (UPF0337 family)